MPAPGQFIPRKSGVHRVACIALYRALLIQCPKIPLPDDIQFFGPVNPIKHLVRRNFRKNVFCTSPRIVVEALKSGYAAEQLLRAAVTGHMPSITTIHSHLHEIHARSTHSRAITPPMPRPPLKPAAYLNAPNILDIRPLPLEQLSGGKRHVPTLSYAEYLPFLRFKRPQSPFLSRILKQKLVTKQKRMDLADVLEEQIGMGEEEEEWEQALRFPHGMPERRGREGIEGKTKKGEWAKEGRGRERVGRDGETKKVYRADDYGREGPWMLASFAERGVVLRRITNDVTRAQRLGVEMLAVADKERELSVQEKEVRRRGKKKSKRARRAERDLEWRPVKELDRASVASSEKERL